MVDTELPALLLQALLGRAGLAVDLAGIARVGVDEHELADVVQQRGDHQPVAGLVADLAGEAVGGALGRGGMQTEALGDPLPDGGALEEVKGAGPRGDRVHGLGGEHVDALHDGLDPATGRSVDLVGQAHDGDRQRDVGLDGGDDVGDRGLAGLEQPQHAIAGLDEHRVGLQRLEGRGQAPAVTLVVVALTRRVRVGRPGVHRCEADSLFAHRSSLAARAHRGLPEGPEIRFIAVSIGRPPTKVERLLRIRSCAVRRRGPAHRRCAAASRRGRAARRTRRCPATPSSRRSRPARVGRPCRP